VNIGSGRYAMKILVINEGARGVASLISIIKMMSVDFSLCTIGEEAVEIAALGEHDMVIVARHHDDIIGNKIASRIRKRNRTLNVIFIPMDFASRRECNNYKHDNVIFMNTPYAVSDLSDLIFVNINETTLDENLKYASRKK